MRDLKPSFPVNEPCKINGMRNTMGMMGKASLDGCTTAASLYSIRMHKAFHGAKFESKYRTCSLYLSEAELCPVAVLLQSAYVVMHLRAAQPLPVSSIWLVCEMIV